MDEVPVPWNTFQGQGICPIPPSIPPDPGLPGCPSSGIPTPRPDNDPGPGVIMGVPPASPWLRAPQGPDGICPHRPLLSIPAWGRALSRKAGRTCQKRHSGHWQRLPWGMIPLSPKCLQKADPERSLPHHLPSLPLSTGDRAASTGQIKQFSRPSGAQPANVNMY